MDSGHGCRVSLELQPSDQCHAGARKPGGAAAPRGGRGALDGRGLGSPTIAQSRTHVSIWALALAARRWACRSCRSKRSAACGMKRVGFASRMGQLREFVHFLVGINRRCRVGQCMNYRKEQMEVASKIPRAELPGNNRWWIGIKEGADQPAYFFVPIAAMFPLAVPLWITEPIRK